MNVVELRRDLHAHPEPSFAETRTTELIVTQLLALGLEASVLPSGTGAVCDVGDDGPLIGLRADIDALPIADLKDVAYRSTVEAMCHACGHDAHTAILLGVAARLVESPPAGRVRLLFQPAEETLPGGAVSVLASGVLDDVEQIYALHCDPQLEVGRVGLRAGAITAACDELDVRFSGPGGHTARPHLTGDLVYTMGRVITELPGLLSRRVDPRAALSLVWGSAAAGRAANVIPSTGVLRGTLRVLDWASWHGAEPLVRELVDQLVAPTGVRAEVAYVRGVPPVVNHAEAVARQGLAVAAALGKDAIAETPQSMGGEDFAWYLDKIPGALARLGVRTAGAPALDLHQGLFDIDEAALEVGVRYTLALVREAHAAG